MTKNTSILAKNSDHKVNFECARMLRIIISKYAEIICFQNDFIRHYYPNYTHLMIEFSPMIR